MGARDPFPIPWQGIYNLCLHVLFSFFTSNIYPSTDDIPEDINDDIISEAAVQATIDFTQYSFQQTAYNAE